MYRTYIYIYIYTYRTYVHIYIYMYRTYICIYVYMCRTFEYGELPYTNGIAYYRRDSWSYICILNIYIYISIYTHMNESHTCSYLNIYLYILVVYTYVQDILIRRTPLYRRECLVITDATVLIYIYIPTHIYIYIYTHPWKSLTYVQIYTYIHICWTFW